MRLYIAERQKLMTKLTKILSLFAMINFTITLSMSSALSNERLQNANEGFSKTVATEFIRLRLATLNAPPPFAFLDRQNNLSGFNLDLARRLCLELSAIKQCEIQAIREDETASALNDRSIDVAIGIFTANNDTRTRFYFSRPFHRPSYYQIIASNAGPTAPSGYIKGDIAPEIASIAFESTQLRGFDTQAELLSALSNNALKSGLLDGTAAQFWLLSDAAKACCNAEGPFYLEAGKEHKHYLVMRLDDSNLHKLVSQTLRTLEINGQIDEIRRRYFPLSSLGSQ